MTYRVVLVVHILAIISWMAGILYLLRLFVNHREFGERSKDNHELLMGMEKRLYRVIAVPAMVVAFGTGNIMIAMEPTLLLQKWLYVKLAAVAILILFTMYCYTWIMRFADRDPSLPSSRTFRILNEVPTLLMIIIVAMVILKPF